MNHFIDIEMTGPHSEVRINDVPVARLNPEPGETFRAVVPVDTAVLPGTNELRVLVDTGPTPLRHDAPHAPGGETTGTVTLKRAPGPTYDADAAGDVTTLSWGEEPLVAAPADLSASFSAPGGRAVPLWAGLEPVTETESLVPFIAEMQALLDAGDIDTLVETQRRAAQEVQRAGGHSEARMLSALRAFLSSALPDKPVTPPVPRDRWDLRPVADGRLVDLVAQDWLPIIRRGTLPSVVGMKLRVGRVDGHWVHVI